MFPLEIESAVIVRLPYTRDIESNLIPLI